MKTVIGVQRLEGIPRENAHREPDSPKRRLSPASQGEPLSDEAQLRQIESALKRLDRGTFGHCLYCGDPISVTRLDRDPAVESCGVCDEG